MSARRIGFAALLACGLGLASLGLLEGLVRVFLPQVLPHDVPELWVPDPAIGWRHRPNARVVTNSGEREVAICTNANGDRIACDGPPRTDCAKRILAIGDSYVEALAVPFEKSVWSRLDADTGACTDVAGVSAYGLSQYRVMARERLSRPGAHYDLVIVALYLGNDLTDDPDTVPPPQEVQHKPVRLLPGGWSQEALRDWLYPWNEWLESRSEAYVAARWAIRRLRDPGHVGDFGVPVAVRPSRFTQALRDATARGVREIAAEARRHGARCLVTVLPHRVQFLDPTGATLLRGLPELAGDVDMDFASREFVPQLRAIPEIDRVVDLLPALRGKDAAKLCGTRDPHLSPDGHAVWFEALRAPVRELLAAGPPPAGS